MSVNAVPWHVHLPPGAEPGAFNPLARGSLPAAWAEQWVAAPTAPALFEARHGWVSNRQLEDVSRRLAGRLRAVGLQPGDHLLFSAETSLELVMAHVAALRAGLVVVPANTVYREREIAHIVRDARPAAALVDDSDRAAWVRRAGGEDLVLVTPDIDLPDGPPGSLDTARPGDPAIIAYTSGTTGAPKGAVLTHGNLLAGSETVGLAWRWTKADRLVLALPLFHVHGLCVGLHGTLLAGASAVLLPRFDVDAVLDAAGEHHATLFFGVPTMYHRLARSARVRELARLRLCVSGSAALPAELHQRLVEVAGQQILERYGMTETLMNVSNPYDGQRRPGSVGLPLPGVELRLSDGDCGEILVRGPNVFAGYWERPDTSAKAFSQGWFHTGDLGALDPDGYLRILGRSKELIITGGFNVYPREVEDVLLAHPGVSEAAVVGAPSNEWGEIVIAFVVPAETTLTPDDLRTFAASQLAPYKRPRRLQFVDALPRNALGKVCKHELMV